MATDQATHPTTIHIIMEEGLTLAEGRATTAIKIIIATMTIREIVFISSESLSCSILIKVLSQKYSQN